MLKNSIHDIRLKITLKNSGKMAKSELFWWFNTFFFHFIEFVFEIYTSMVDTWQPYVLQGQWVYERLEFQDFIQQYPDSWSPVITISYNIV